MRPEKKYLVQAVDGYIGDSDYLFVADYQRITVAEIAELRSSLKPTEAHFHVVKNSVLNVAIKDRGMPELTELLNGPTALICGGRNPSEVAKILKKFHKSKNKVEVKGGLLSGKRMSSNEVSELAELPSLEVLQAQLLSLFNTPARGMVRVMQVIPEGVLNVLQAKSQKET